MFMLNNEKTNLESIQTNLLGVCLLSNDVETFKFLHQLGCDLFSMERIFNDQGVNSLELICLKGNSQVLGYFWPLYKTHLKHKKFTQINEKSLSSNLKAFPNYNFSPVQLATIFGHIQIITTLHHELSDKDKSLAEIDLNAKETRSGMNCALLAVKSGRLKVVKYLFYNYSCDFHAVDVNENNAIDIAFIENEVRPNGEYKGIVCFLIEAVGVKFELKISYLKTLEKDLELKEYLQKKYQEMNSFKNDDELGEDFTIYSKGESGNENGTSWNSIAQVSREFGFRNP
jgi:hypothetical protein